MKKLIQFIIIVVVALTGFPQHSMGQVLPCKKLTIAPFMHDSSFLYINQTNFDTIVKIAERIVNPALLDFKVVCFSRPMKKIEPISNSIYWDFRTKNRELGTTVSYFYAYFYNRKFGNYDSTVTHPVLIENQINHIHYYPGSLGGRSICVATATGGKYGQDAFVLNMNDSFPDPQFWGIILAREILLNFGAKVSATDDGTVMSQNPWKATSKVAEATKLQIKNSGNYRCLDNLTSGCPVTTDVTRVDEDQTLSFDQSTQMLFNPKGLSVSVMTLMGIKALNSKEIYISLWDLPPGSYILFSPKREYVTKKIIIN